MPASIVTTIALVGGAAVVAALVVRRLRRAFQDHLLRGMPRLQQFRFVHRLRDEAFADPTGVVATLSGNNAGAYLSRLWAQARGDVKRAEVEIARANPSAAERLKPLTETEWPAERFVAQSVPVAQGWSLAVVLMPPSERGSETIFAGIAVPNLDGASDDTNLAKQNVRFFQLNTWALGRDTDFIEQTSGGRTLTYNIGTERTVEAFAAAIADKIREGRKFK